MFALFNEPYSEETEKRKELILKNKLALYDAVQSCTVEGSMDSSLKDIILADLPSLIGESQIHAIFLNGKKAYELYCRKPVEGIPFYLLPSSSPANAVYSLEDLEKAYAEIKRHLV
jgi:TDG/mug DNA glycosylase family protein